MDASITAELDRGFNFMASATVSRHSRQKAEFEQSLKSARIACETAKKLLAESADERSAEFQMRLNALESIVLDASNTNLTQAAVAHG